MKKFLCAVAGTVLCIALLVCAVGCGSEQTSGDINLATCEIGDEIPVYPSCEFDYVVNDDVTVHVKSIRAILTAKNEIHDGDVLRERFDPYEVKLQFTGSTSQDNAGKIVLIHISLQTFTATIRSIVDAEGGLLGEVVTSVKFTPSIAFDRIELSYF